MLGEKKRDIYVRKKIREQIQSNQSLEALLKLSYNRNENEQMSHSRKVNLYFNKLHPRLQIPLYILATKEIMDVQLSL